MEVFLAAFAPSVDLAGALEAVEAGALPAVEAGLGAIVYGKISGQVKGKGKRLKWLWWCNEELGERPMRIRVLLYRYT